MAVRVLWAVCLAVGAMVTGVGIELHSTGAEEWVSYPVVVAGIALLPLASLGIQRLAGAPVTRK